jgi:hypothetical protein
MMFIENHETEIIGKWISVNGSVIADACCQRIIELTDKHLIEMGRDESGWDALFRDPSDGRLWELIYPHSEMQGGGPPQLRLLSEHAAAAKYRCMKSLPPDSPRSTPLG